MKEVFGKEDAFKNYKVLEKEEAFKNDKAQPNHLHCALIMRSKARLFTIYETDANKVTFHSTL